MLARLLAQIIGRDYKTKLISYTILAIHKLNMLAFGPNTYIFFFFFFFENSNKSANRIDQ